MKHTSQGISIHCFVLMAGIIILLIGLLIDLVAPGTGYTQTQLKAFSELLGKSIDDKPHFITVNAFDYLFADDGQPVRHRCHICN